MTLHMTHMTHLQFKCNVENRFLLAEFSLGPGAGRRQHCTGRQSVLCRADYGSVSSK